MNVVAVDLGTEVIAAAVGRLRGDNLVVKGYSERYIMDPTLMERGNVRYVRGVSEVVERTVREALNNAGLDRREVEGVGLSMTGDRFEIQEKAIRVTPEGSVGWEDIGRSIVERLEFSDRVRPVSVDIVELEVNGTEVDPRELSSEHPEGIIGSRASEVRFRAIVSSANPTLVHNLERIADILNLKLITVSIEPIAVAKSLTAEQRATDYLLIDSGGGTTDVSMIRDSSLELCKTIKVGGRDFTLALANEFGLTYEEAESLKKKLNSPVADEELAKYGISRSQALEPIEEVAEYVRDTILSAVKRMIRAADLQPPDRVGLYGGGILLDQAENAVREAVMLAYRDYLGTVPRIHILDAARVVPHTGRRLQGPMRVVALSVLRDTALCQRHAGARIEVEVDEMRAPEGRYTLEVSGRLEDTVRIPRKTGLKQALISFIKEVIFMEPSPLIAKLKGRAYAGTVAIRFDGLDGNRVRNVEGVRIRTLPTKSADEVRRLPYEYIIVQVKEMGPILIPVDEIVGEAGEEGETEGHADRPEERLDDTGSRQPN